MPSPIQPQGTTPGLSAADLKANQAAQAQARQTQANLEQQKLQQQSEKGVFRRIYDKSIKRGSLIAFQYNYYKHDPFPLCLVGKMWGGKQAGMVSGLNLHYLTFRYMKQLVDTFCGKNFHYGLIKGNQYIVNSYRSYKKDGRRQVKVLDCDFLNGVLKTARSFKPNEVEAIRKEVQRQLKEKMHPTAKQFAKEFQNTIYNQPHRDYNIGKAQPDGRFNPTDITPPE